MNELEKAIKKTKAYGRNFGVKYSPETIAERLISNKVFSLKDIVSKVGKVIDKNKNRSEFSEKVELALRFAREVERRFETVLFLGITGSVAAGSPDKGSDIDLMIITKKDTLWLTRLFIRLFVSWNQIPHRIYGQSEKGNDFCFNLWLDEEGLTLPHSKRTLKNAMDLILVKPLLNRQEAYERFIKANSWASSYVATGYSLKTSKIGRRLQINLQNNSVLKPFNKLAFWMQYMYMRRKISNELIDEHRAFFHPNQ